MQNACEQRVGAAQDVPYPWFMQGSNGISASHVALGSHYCILDGKTLNSMIFFQFEDTNFGLHYGISASIQVR